MFSVRFVVQKKFYELIGLGIFFYPAGNIVLRISEYDASNDVLKANQPFFGHFFWKSVILFTGMLFALVLYGLVCD